jgi:hypothetical protein
MMGVAPVWMVCVVDHEMGGPDRCALTSLSHLIRIVDLQSNGPYCVPVQGWRVLILAVPIDRMVRVCPYPFAEPSLHERPYRILKLTHRPCAVENKYE